MAKNKGGTESIRRKIDMLNRIKSQTPSQVGRLLVREFKTNFDLQGFQDSGVARWKRRKKTYSHPILVKSGRLKKSIVNTLANWKTVRIESNTPYGGYHNYGSKYLPVRKFMGRSRTIENKAKMLYINSVNRAMRA